MKRRLITAIAAAALLIPVAAPLSESVALGAQKKRSCNCKPALRKSRSKARVKTASAVAIQNGDANAAVVGPVFATYTLPQNQYFRLRMNQTLNSGTARVGDRFQATVVTPVYASGVEMIHNEFEGDVKADCVFEGTNGTILVSRGGISSRPDAILQEPLDNGAERVYPSDNHRQNWLDCIRSGSACICPAEIGHRSATICHLGNIGYWHGRKLRWDPAKEQFADDQEADALLSREPREPWKV